VKTRLEARKLKATKTGFTAVRDGKDEEKGLRAYRLDEMVGEGSRGRPPR
jgi:hypothetical protein